MIIIEDRGKQYKVNIGDFSSFLKFQIKSIKINYLFNIIFHKNSQKAKQPYWKPLH